MSTLFLIEYKARVLHTVPNLISRHLCYPGSIYYRLLRNNVQVPGQQGTTASQTWTISQVEAAVGSFPYTCATTAGGITVNSAAVVITANGELVHLSGNILRWSQISKHIQNVEGGPSPPPISPSKIVILRCFFSFSMLTVFFISSLHSPTPKTNSSSVSKN